MYLALVYDGDKNCSATLGSVPGNVSVSVGAVFLIGIVLSFIPQIVKIIRRRSSEGISALFCFCSSTMGSTNLTGAAVLQYKVQGTCIFPQFAL